MSPGIVVTSDGGGIVHAAMRPVSGHERVARYLVNLAARLGPDPLVVPCELNGEPAVLTHGTEGWAAVTVSVEDGSRHGDARRRQPGQVGASGGVVR